MRGSWFRNCITGEPQSWVVETLQGDPMTPMEEDVLKFQLCVERARLNFGTDTFWHHYFGACVLWRRWWQRGLGLMRREKLASLRRTHFNQLYMPENSDVSVTFWQVYQQVEDLMYPTTHADEPTRDDAKITALIDHLFVLHNICLQRSGRSICDIRILIVLGDQHNKDVKDLKEKGEKRRQQTRPLLRVLGRSVRSSRTLKKTGS